MKISERKTRADRTVYIQFRQARRGKDGKLKVVASKTRTVENADIAKVEALCMAAIAAA